MALIKCPECGNKISDKSDECVHCGFPIGEIEIPTIVKRKCEYCGRINEGYGDNCVGCGADLSTVKIYKKTREKRKIEMKENPDRRICSTCGKIIPVFEKYCTSCFVEEPQKIQEGFLGARGVEGYAISGKKKDKWVALFLCIFFGYFGVHKFYEGRIALGIVYLCTMGLFGFGWLADILILALKSNPYYV